MRISLLAGFLLSAVTLVPAQTHTNWSYEGRTGPLLWGRLSPEYAACSKGHEQSPVDIQKARLNPGLQPIQFHYMAGAVTLENTGHTVQVHVNPGSYIIANGVRYDLVQFHFHHPSEHTIKRKLSDMEIHLVHRSADGKQAVVAVFLSEDMGAPNATLATLWEHLPTHVGQTEKITDMVNPGGLLPADRAYWTYTGSLTSPPCTEDVSWFVYQEKISMSRSQYNAFANLYKMNARPTQDLHGRKIEDKEVQ